MILKTRFDAIQSRAVACFGATRGLRETAAERNKGPGGNGRAFEVGVLSRIAEQNALAAFILLRKPSNVTAGLTLLTDDLVRPTDFDTFCEFITGPAAAGGMSVADVGNAFLSGCEILLDGSDEAVRRAAILISTPPGV